MEAGHRGHCESGTMILLCLTALVLFVNLNCLNLLVSNLQLEEFKGEMLFLRWRHEDKPASHMSE